MNTKKLIIEVARKKFLEHGYKKANIRDIADDANVSIGAIYGYFTNKKMLYKASIGDLPRECYEQYIKAITSIDSVDIVTVFKQLKTLHYEGIDLFIDYIYADMVAWKLTLSCEHINYKKYVDTIVEKKVEVFNVFLQLLDKAEIEYFEPDSHLVKAAFYNLVGDLLDIIKFDMDRNDAIRYSEQVADFFIAGWVGILKLNTKELSL